MKSQFNWEPPKNGMPSGHYWWEECEGWQPEIVEVESENCFGIMVTEIITIDHCGDCGKITKSRDSVGDFTGILHGPIEPPDRREKE